MKCKKCLYMWDTRVKDPKSCPRCKSRLDFIIIKNINNRIMEVN
ncbi:MAG: hypothetical protein AABW46_01525 [Nanoarchaeota archaeon]